MSRESAMGVRRTRMIGRVIVTVSLGSADRERKDKVAEIADLWSM
jgi:hypothetical protein